MNPLDQLSQLVHAHAGGEDYDPNAMSVAQARHYIQQFLSPVQDTETVPITHARGRVLAAEVVSGMQVPGHDNSAMDGYAFRHAEAGSPLTLVGTALAGQPYQAAIPAGACIKIMTGGMLPADLDTVVMQEHATLQDGLVSFAQCPPCGTNIRRAGEDIQRGQTVLNAGHVLQPADMGLLASLGIAKVTVYRRLKVAFFSTGDELVSVGQSLQPGQIYDSNRYSVRGMLEALEVTFNDLGHVADDPQALEQQLLSAAHAHDVVITTGGVSVGEADFMKMLLAKHGQVLFWKINMKPGRPLAYGKVGQAHYFGLPGNPVATMVTFYQFVQDALKRLMGSQALPVPTWTVPCSTPLKKAPGRMEFQRGILYATDSGWQVKATGEQGSGILSSMSQANCFIVLDESCGALPAGSLVQVQPFYGVLG